jgi:RNA polymerase sigma factor (TIGR02999 family)
MDGSASATVTRLLDGMAGGDPSAAEALLPLVYEELRQLARQRMRQERPDHTLQATALVHEAFLRLVENGKSADCRWEGRGHFFAAAAEAMRRIIVDRARQSRSLKRGGNRKRLDLGSLELSLAEPPEDLLSLDEALNEFAKVHEQKAMLVKLKFFAGLTTAEAADALGISCATAERHWSFARAWLYRRIGGATEGAT